MEKLIKKNWKQTLWKTLNVISSVALIANMSMIGVFIAPKVASAAAPIWPADATWQNYQLNGHDVTDYEDGVNGINDKSNGGTNVTPTAIDIASGAPKSGTNPGIYPSFQYSVGSEYLFVRMRLVGDPVAPGGSAPKYINYHWDVLVDKDGNNTSDYVIDIFGNGGAYPNGTIGIYPNNPGATTYDPTNPLWTAEASDASNLYTQTQTIPYAGFSNQYWLEFAAPLANLTGFNPSNFKLFGSTSTSNTDPLQKDWMSSEAFFVQLTQHKSVANITHPGYTTTALPVQPGDLLRYTLTVTNSGTKTAPGYVVSDDVSDIVLYTSNPSNLNPNTGSYNTTTKVVSWPQADIAPGVTLTDKFDVTVKSANLLPTTGDFTATNIYGDTINIPFCNLTITKSVDKQNANPGDTLTYTLHYKNTGTADCTGGGVRVDDTVPAGVTYNGTHTQTAGTDYGYQYAKFGNGLTNINPPAGASLISWNANVLNPGEEGEVTWQGTVNATPACTEKDINNVGKIYSNENTTGVTSNQVSTHVSTPCYGSIQVNKKVDVNGNGTYVNDNPSAYGFKWGVDGGTNNLAMGSTQGTLSVGNHTVNENSVADYHFTGWYADSAVAAKSCANPDGTTLPVTVPVSANTTTTITLCNAHDTGTISFDKVVVGGTAKDSDFTFTANGKNYKDGDSDTFATGTYGVTESGPDGYTLTGASGVCSINQDGHIVLNATVNGGICHVTNTRDTGTLIVKKHVINDNGGTKTAGDFTMNVTGQNPSKTSFAGDEDGTSVTLETGSYSADETDLPGYAKSLGADCSGTITKGETKTCVITNDDITAHLKLVKHVTNDNGGNALPTDWTLTATGPTTITGAGTAEKDVNAGSYTLSESGPSGYKASDWTCDDGSLKGDQLTLGLGESATCDITNDDTAPTITLNKVVDNNHGGNAGVNDFGLTIGSTSVTSGQTLSVDANKAYALDEAGLSGYKFVSLTGDEGCPTELGGTVTLNEGENITCTITNEDIAPTITLNKVVDNNHGGNAGVNDFGLTIGSTSVTSGQILSVDANKAYALDEAGLSGYKFVSLTGDEGCPTELGGTVTLNEGENITCTITNEDIAPELTVIKHVVNDNGGTAVAGDFTMNVTGTNVSDSSFAGSEAGVTVTLDQGSYNVDENAFSGYAKSLSTDCTGTINVGEKKTCTITNNDQTAHLTLNKIVDNNGVGTADKEDWNLAADGPTPIDGDGYVSEDVNTGTYTLSESGPKDFTASEWSCVKNDGEPVTGASITLALGESATCEITNTGIRGHVSGTKFEDKNGNGAFDAGDTPVAEWPISLFKKIDTNWVLQGSPVLTDINGHYEFNDLGMGEYKVSENPLLPWIPVIPTIDSDGFYAYTFTVAPGSDYQYDFLNYRLGSISGYKFNDLNGNGVWNTDEPGIYKWSVSLTGPKNVGPVYTDQNGYYEFDNLPQGEYTVTEDTSNTAWIHTTNDSISGLDIVDSNTSLTGNNFGNFKLGRISGYKMDQNEKGLLGWQICIDSEALDGKDCTTTDETGYYEFTGLHAGSYVVSETLKPGWVQLSPTDPNTYTVNVISGTDSHNDFVNRMNEFGVDIEKTGQATVNAGDQITYTLNWSITGNTPVTNAKVTDVLPANTTFVSADNSGTFDSTTKTITWDLGTATPVMSGTVHLVVKTVSPLDNGTVITNTGKICGTGVIPQLLTVAVQQQGTEKCDTSTTTTTTNSAPVLGISKTNDKPVGVPGDKVNYTIKWSVDGNAKATNVTITDTVPVELTVDTGTISNGGTYNAGTRIITWNLGTQVPHAEGTVTYSGNIVSPLANGTQIVNITKITSTETDPKFWQSESTTTVKSAPVLVITKVVTPTETVAGTQVTYTVVIKNTGNDAAVNVKMTDLLPAGFTFDEFGGSSHTYTLGNLAAGAQTTVAYKVNIGKDVAAGSYDNLAVASADNHPNVSAKATVKIGVVQGVEALPKLTITKTADQAFINPGGHVTYHVTITNTGDAPAINVQLQDVMPAGFTFDVGGITKTWSLGDLAVGASVKVAYTAISDKSVLPGSYENIAVAWSDNNDKVTATVPVEVRKVQVLGAELPKTGVGIQGYIYFFTAGMLLLFSLYLLSLTFKKESD